MFGTSMVWKSRRLASPFKFGICSVAALLVAGLALPANAQNLLGNPSFDTAPPLFPGGVNILVSTSPGPNYESGYTVGQWGAESGTIVATGNAGQSDIGYPSAASILPLSNPYMLDLAGPGTGFTSQVWQLIAVPAADLPAVESGGASATFSMYFNRPAFTAANPASAGAAAVYLQFYPAAYLQTYSQLNIPGVPIAADNSAYISPNTWTQLSVTATIPSDTAYILAQMAFGNASMTDVNGVNYDGYIDDVTLAVPEPASMGLIILSALGALGMRRRKTA